METKRMVKLSSVTLAVFLLSLSAFYILAILLGYTFVPFNGVVLNIFTTSLILWFAISGMKHRNEKAKISDVCSMLLAV